MMIVGRKKEQALLERAFATDEAQLITICGRQGVGKTFLVEKFFSTKECHFLHVTGLRNKPLKVQIEQFTKAFAKTFYDYAPLLPRESWEETFWGLTRRIEAAEGKIILFFDELQWLASPRSQLMKQIEQHWASSWSHIPSLILIGCGSSVPWFKQQTTLKKRATMNLQLMPYSLEETEEFLSSKKISFSKEEVLSIYMAIGGIPKYLNYLLPGYTVQQNIQLLYFDENAPLKREYDKLFYNADAYKELLEIIAQERSGMERADIKKQAHYSTGGYLTKRLQDLCMMGSIKEYIPLNKTYGSYYKITDEFCLFYLLWIKGHSEKTFDQDHWLIQSQRPAYYAWAGYAFEAVCSKHIHQIIRTLGIKMVNMISSWRYVPKDNHEKGAQIDLIIDRIDDGITLCEMKYTKEPFVIDKSYAQVLNNRISLFKKQTKVDKQIFLAFVSANGIKPTLYSEEMLSGIVTLEDLFRQFN